MKLFNSFFLIAFLGLAVISTPTKLNAQNENVHFVKSGFNGKTYELKVSLPKSYVQSDAIKYPVLFLLDGKGSYLPFTSTRGTLDLAKELKDIIIVAIDDSTNTDNNFIVSRNLDFTPSAHPQTDTLFSKIFGLPDGTLKSGGADNFLNTIEKQIIPFISKTYKTTEDRGITGHSLGGLLTAYCLIKKPMLFNRYGINSPALWWNNLELIQLEESFKEVNKNIKAKVFFSIGGDEDPLMLAPFNTFINTIKTRNYRGLSVTVKVFEEETHLSVVPAMGSRTLKVLYGTNVN